MSSQACTWLVFFEKEKYSLEEIFTLKESEKRAHSSPLWCVWMSSKRLESQFFLLAIHTKSRLSICVVWCNKGQTCLRDLLSGAFSRCHGEDRDERSRINWVQWRKFPKFNVSHLYLGSETVGAELSARTLTNADQRQSIVNWKCWRDRVTRQRLNGCVPRFFCRFCARVRACGQRCGGVRDVTCIRRETVMWERRTGRERRYKSKRQRQRATGDTRKKERERGYELESFVVGTICPPKIFAESRVILNWLGLSEENRKQRRIE